MDKEPLKLYVNMLDHSKAEYADKPTVYIAGRDEQQQYHCLRFTHFEPSFYVRNRDTYLFEDSEKLKRMEFDCGFVNLHGEPMSRVVAHIPKEIGTGPDCLRNILPREDSCQGDILFNLKVWLDIGAKRCISVKNETVVPCEYFNVPKRISYLDIETGGYGNNIPNYKNATDPVILYTSFDSYRKEFDTFMYFDLLDEPYVQLDEVLESHVPKKFRMPGYDSYKWNVYAFNNEKRMLNSVINYYDAIKFDIMAGWNSSGGPNKNKRYRPGFDLQYMIGRMKRLRLDYSRLSPINEVYIRSNGEVTIKMVSLVDLLYYWIHSRTKSSKFNNLDYVSKLILRARKVKRKGKVIELLNTRPKRAREYNAVDVELPLLLDVNLNLIEDKQRIADEDGIFLNKVLYTSVGWDMQIIRKFNGMGIVLPNKPTMDAFGKFTGGFVHQAFVGVEENILVLDLTKLYPYTMMSLNADPRTLVYAESADSITDAELKDLIKSPIDGVYFKKNPISVYVELYDNYIKLRNKFQVEMTKWENIDTFKFNYYDQLQTVTKYKTNGLYGYLGMKRSRLANRYIAESTTLMGQMVIKWTIERLKEIGYITKYGDTDSVMIKLHRTDIKDMVAEARYLADYLNKSYDQLAQNLNMDRHFFSIKPETIAKRMLMQESKDGDPSKKTYAMWVVWHKGKFKSEHVLNSENRLIKGFPLKKSNFSNFASQVQLSVIDTILNGKGKDAVKHIVKSALKLHRILPLKDIMFPSTMARPFSGYGGVTADGRQKPIPYIVKAARWSNAHLDTGFGAGSKFYLIYTNLPDGEYVAIDYNRSVPPIIKENIDWTGMEKRNIWNMVNGMLNIVGLSEQEIKNEETIFSVLRL
jgi:DNA polymerase elongation subunit (family B)